MHREVWTQIQIWRHIMTTQHGNAFVFVTLCGGNHWLQMDLSQKASGMWSYDISLELPEQVNGQIVELLVNRYDMTLTWWRHHMETFSALLAICAGNSPVPCEFHKGQWRGALMFSLVCGWINGWVNNCEWGWWFETLSHPLWRHCNGSHVIAMVRMTKSSATSGRACSGTYYSDFIMSAMASQFITA